MKLDEKNMLQRMFIIGVVMLVSISVSIAQVGKFDVQFTVSQSADCNLGEAYFDLEIKAADANSTFRISDQNYRFSFNRAALANPRIVEEFDISGLIDDGINGSSFYSPHSLNGSVDTVLSYGFELSGGVGYFIGDDNWVSIGRVAFDIVDTTASAELVWHDSGTFPATFVGEIVNGTDLYIARENEFINMESDISSICSPLPIELISFSGEEKACGIQLTWETQSETNSSHFIVQKSNNGLSFSDLDRVEAAGFSNILLTYDFVDETAGVYNYYRLKQVDMDGSYEYSKIIKVESTCYEPDIINGITDLYPNPGINGRAVRVHVYTDNVQTSAELVLRNVSGQIMYKKNIALGDGANTVSFIPEKLPAGLYLLQIKSDSWFSQSQKLLIAE